MQQKSRRTILTALVFPAALSVATLIATLALIPQAPSEIVMQWSGGEPSRYGHPAELLFVPVIAVAISAIMWAALGSAPPNGQRFAVILGNALNAGLNATALIMLLTQLAPNPGAGLSGTLLALIPAVVVGLITFLLVRTQAQ
ncbi:MAG: DUF1648 domain-containing protein [Microbacteriaceae bacterium]|nr:DUF1648 domain-containing protein [Microbacteriaceae bacterium]